MNDQLEFTFFACSLAQVPQIHNLIQLFDDSKYVTRTWSHTAFLHTCKLFVLGGKLENFGNVNFGAYIIKRYETWILPLFQVTDDRQTSSGNYSKTFFDRFLI